MVNSKSVVADAFRIRTFALLSKAYTTIHLNMVQSYLGQPVEDVLNFAKENNWSYDPSIQTLKPARPVESYSRNAHDKRNDTQIGNLDKLAC